MTRTKAMLYKGKAYGFYKRYRNRKQALEVAAQLRRSPNVRARVETVDTTRHDVYIGYRTNR